MTLWVKPHGLIIWIIPKQEGLNSRVIHFDKSLEFEFDLGEYFYIWSEISKSGFKIFLRWF